MLSDGRELEVELTRCERDGGGQDRDVNWDVSNGDRATSTIGEFGEVIQ